MRKYCGRAAMRARKSRPYTICVRNILRRCGNRIIRRRLEMAQRNRRTTGWHLQQSSSPKERNTRKGQDTKQAKRKDGKMSELQDAQVGCASKTQTPTTTSSPTNGHKMKCKATPRNDEHLHLMANTRSVISGEGISTSTPRNDEHLHLMANTRSVISGEGISTSTPRNDEHLHLMANTRSVISEEGISTSNDIVSSIINIGEVFINLYGHYPHRKRSVLEKAYDNACKAGRSIVQCFRGCKTR